MAREEGGGRGEKQEKGRGFKGKYSRTPREATPAELLAVVAGGLLTSRAINIFIRRFLFWPASRFSAVAPHAYPPEPLSMPLGSTTERLPPWLARYVSFARISGTRRSGEKIGGGDEKKSEKSGSKVSAPALEKKREGGRAYDCSRALHLTRAISCHLHPRDYFSSIVRSRATETETDARSPCDFLACNARKNKQDKPRVVQSASLRSSRARLSLRRISGPFLPFPRR